MKNDWWQERKRLIVKYRKGKITKEEFIKSWTIFYNIIKGGSQCVQFLDM